MLGYPFRLSARLRKDGARIFRTIGANHYHDPSTEMRAHPISRYIKFSTQIYDPTNVEIR